jgi:alcohol dehydrogenase (NADP+)
MKTLGYAAQSATSPLELFTFQRRALRPNDIVMEILYCGICHTDLHQARNDWGFTQ